MPPPAVALWGTGGLTQAFAGACRSLGWPIPCVAARSPVVATALARELGADAISLADLQRDGRADLVIAAPEPRPRAGEIEALLGAGLHVVAAPPLAPTPTEADEIVALVAGAGRSFVYADHLCLAPVVQQLFARLGDLATTPTHISSRTIEPHDASNAAGRSQSALDHHGAASIAVALLSARICELGDALAVSTDTTASGDATELRIGFANGREARVHAGWGPSAAPVWDFQVATPAEVLRIDLHPTPVLERNGEPLAAAGSRSFGHDPAEALGFIPLLRGFWADISVGAPPVLPALFGRAVVEIVAAARRSTARREPVDLPLAPRSRAAGTEAPEAR